MFIYFLFDFLSFEHKSMKRQLFYRLGTGLAKIVNFGSTLK